MASKGGIQICGSERPGRCYCTEAAGHHGRHYCSHCKGDWENEAETKGCMATEVAILGVLEPNGARLRCGLLDGHDGPHLFGMAWR